MTALPIVDTALEGFRITRERPLAVLAWGGVILIGQALTTALLVNSGAGEALEAFRAAGPPTLGAADPERAALLARAAPGVLGASGFGLLANVVVLTALLRAVLQPDRARFGFLRVGLEELRQLGVTLSILLLSMLGFVMVFSAAALLAAPLAAGGNSQFAAALALTGGVVAGLYPAVRLSLAPALSQAEGKFALVPAWALTRGLFWPLLGAYVIAAALTAVVAVMAGVVLTAGWALVAGGGVAGAAAVLQPDLRTVAGALSPPSIAALAFNAVLAAFLLTLVAAPTAAALKVLGRAR